MNRFEDNNQNENTNPKDCENLDVTKLHDKDLNAGITNGAANSVQNSAQVGQPAEAHAATSPVASTQQNQPQSSEPAATVGYISNSENGTSSAHSSTRFEGPSAAQQYQSKYYSGTASGTGAQQGGSTQPAGQPGWENATAYQNGAASQSGAQYSGATSPNWQYGSSTSAGIPYGSQTQSQFNNGNLTGAQQGGADISLQGQHSATNQGYQPYYSSTIVEKKKRKMGAGGVVAICVASVVLLGGVTAAVLLPGKPSKPTGRVGTAPYTESAPTTKPLTPSAAIVPSGKPLTSKEIAQKVGPAVVGIVNKGKGSGILRQEVEQGSGSGIIISEDGYIVTNNHVINGATSLNVILSNGKSYPAELVGSDVATDIALIKIKEKGLPFATLGDSSLMEAGDDVIAIGNPLGQELFGSVSKGIVSATNRKIGGDTESLIQTDAAINPGNSGGALINVFGEVIGINTLKFSGSGLEGLGFAIPINSVKPTVSDLTNFGYVKGRLLIGVSGQDITDDVAKTYKVPTGVLVREVTPFSGADRAGIKVGDIITSVNGQAIKSINQMNEIKAKFKAGDTLNADIDREGKKLTVGIVLTEQTPAQQPKK